jgi:hypothetical protein
MVRSSFSLAFSDFGNRIRPTSAVGLAHPRRGGGKPLTPQAKMESLDDDKGRALWRQNPTGEPIHAKSTT